MKKIIANIKKRIRENRHRFIITLLVFILLVAYFYPHIFIFVKPGEAGVLWKRFSGGTVIDKPYLEGTHIIFPWDKIYVYNVRNQEVKDSVDVLSKNGLTIHLDISIRYHPNVDIIGLMHKMVGPEYERIVIIPEIEAVVRTVIGQYTPEEIYTDQKAIAEYIVEMSYTQVEERFISLDDVLIKRISLPEKIKGAIEAKLEQQQIAQEFEFRIQREKKEAERKRIEADGISRYNQIIAQNLTEDILRWHGIKATHNLALSPNAKVVVIGAGENGLPVILGNQ